MKNTHGYQVASKGKRLIARFVEGSLFTSLAIGIYVLQGNPVADYWNDDFELIEILYSTILGLIIGAVCYPLFSGNIGHRMLNLKVISSETGEDYKESKKGAIREGLKNALGILIIPIIWILWDDRNQNLYDKLTKTIVVENNKIV